MINSYVYKFLTYFKNTTIEKYSVIWHFADDKYCHNDGLPIKEGETGPAGKGCHRVTCNKAPNGISGVG